MALFGRFTPRPVRVQFVPVPVHNQYLPAEYRNLPCVCQGHGLPVPMRFAGFSKTAKGDPSATYQCPLCGHREIYVRDFTTRRPRLLFSRG